MSDKEFASRMVDRLWTTARGRREVREGRCRGKSRFAGSYSEVESK